MCSVTYLFYNSIVAASKKKYYTLKWVSVSVNLYDTTTPKGENWFLWDNSERNKKHKHKKNGALNLT